MAHKKGGSQGRSEGITRVSVDLTDAQRRAVDHMRAVVETRASEAAGLPVEIGMREFFHMILKKQAQELGVEWPEDYPSAGGFRGGQRKTDD